MSRLKTILGTVAAAGVAGWLYASPYLTVRSIATAASAKDAVALSKHVDYPAVRESLKAGIRARAAERLGRDADNPLAVLGVVVAGGIADFVVDGLVTPEGIGLMLKGDLPRNAVDGSDAPGGPGGSEPPADAGPPPAVTQGYVAWDRFEVRSEDRRRPGRVTTLTLVRHGLADWKLAAIDLP